MHRFALALMVGLIAGCNTAETRDVSSPYYKIPPGSAIVLNRELGIPAGQAHIKLQGGTPAGAVDEYTVNCTFNTRNLGPLTIRPDTFAIRETSSMQDWVSRPDIMRFYREFRLTSASQPDVMSFVCQDWDGPLVGRPVSAPEMEQAVGSYVSFRFSPQ